MVKLKAGGIVLGGFAAYLLLSKGISAVHGCVRSVCESRNWKNYYKYGKEGNMVPPGYSRRTSYDNGEIPATKPEESKKQASTGEAIGRAVSDAIARMINDTFGPLEAVKGASEGQNECPHDCDNCEAQKCPYETLKYGGKITEWSEDGRPIAGCYPWDTGEELHWWVDRSGEAHSVMEDVSEEAGKTAQETGKGTDDNIIQMPIDIDGDYDGDKPDHPYQLHTDPDIIKMAKEAIEKNNSVIDKPKED